jgi:RNA polymerase sigma-70 factor (family 1)
LIVHNNSKLAERIRNDDVNAFTELYRKYHAAVYANALKLTRNEQVAEDIVQEVFITLWEKRQDIDPKKDISGWLFVISYNKSINILKRKLRETCAHEKIRNIAGTVEVPHEKNELLYYRLSNLVKAIEELSPQKRKVFELCKMRGKTYEEAARELHLSKYTVKEYLAGAMIFIKDYLKKHPVQQGVFLWIATASNLLFHFVLISW